MKRISKGVISLLALGCFSLFMQALLSSCQNEKNEFSSDNEMSKALLKDFVVSGQGMATKPIVNSSATNSNRVRKTQKRSSESSFNSYEDTNLTISVDFPPETEEDIKKLFDEVLTMEELIELRDLTNAVYTYDAETANAEYSISVSKETVLEMMDPMIERSKKFLKEEKGFTETEIQEMLLENNADESQLVPLVMFICEEELKAEPTLEARSFIFNLFATPCYAISTGNHTLDCAIKAIGADVLVSMAQSGLKTWSKALIKKSFKVIAKRALGPVGVAIAVVEFSLCI